MAIGDELSSIDFDAMLGGPLSAVVRAQAQSAQTSVDFIKAVGFDEDTNEPTMITFNYTKVVETRNEEGEVIGAEPKPFTLTVPFLTMLPIPFIRVEETTIAFNAKITSVQSWNTTSSNALTTTMEKKAGLWFASAKLKANFSYQKSTSSSSKISRTYSLSVNVRAVQDELPAGTERLLGILENTITEVAVEETP
ncbi:DUF2589 domain-containing protein [Vibrio natriegens]|uniref:DUF2589 domain-containing protein n=1 Tax=Vibrio natriegens TaxID=691 RepID=UPI003B5994A3